MTSVPPRPVARNACEMISVVRLPTATMTVSAPRAAGFAGGALVAPRRGRLGRVRGPEAQREIALGADRVDRDDRACAGMPRSLYRVEADPAGAHHDYGVAYPGGGRVHGRSPAGHDAAANQGDGPQRHRRVHLDAGVLGDDGELGEGAEAAEPAEPVGREP
jgi:hypothetical protein